MLRGRGSAVLGAVTAVLVLVSACTTGTQEPDDALDTSNSVDRGLWELGGLGDAAASPIDEFWSQELGGPDAGYTSPTAVVPYRPGDVPDTECGPRLPADDWVGNAYYCDLDSTIAYDADFVTGLIERNGEHAGLAVLAHEWAHHVQALRGGGLYTIQRELEADCLAAYYLGQVELLGGPDAMDSTMQTFYRLGDGEYSEASWFASGEHGSPNQRFAAAATGYFAVDSWSPYCGGFGMWSPGSRVELGPWSLLEIPGHRGDVGPDGTYRVDASSLPALTVERVPLDWEGQDAAAAATAWLATQQVARSDGPYPQGDGYALVYVEREEGGAGPEMVGVLGDAEDPDHVLVVRATFTGELTTSADDSAFMVPAGLVSIVGTRVCRPGEQAADPAAGRYNYVCDPDL